MSANIIYQMIVFIYLLIIEMQVKPEHLLLSLSVFDVCVTMGLRKTGKVSQNILVGMNRLTA